jgi:hypothetical protein
MSLAANKRMRDERLKSIYNHIVDWTEQDIEMFEINKYQFRFVKGEHRIDYYPTSGKYFDLNLKKWGTIPAFKLITLFNCEI